MHGKILKTVLNIVNLYRGMSKLKLKINLNLLQLLCIVFLWVYMANLSDLVGFALTVTIHYKKETYNV